MEQNKFICILDWKDKKVLYESISLFFKGFIPKANRNRHYKHIFNGKLYHLSDKKLN